MQTASYLELITKAKLNIKSAEVSQDIKQLELVSDHTDIPIFSYDLSPQKDLRDYNFLLCAICNDKCLAVLHLAH